jgi:hypothetical protein
MTATLEVPTMQDARIQPTADKLSATRQLLRELRIREAELAAEYGSLAVAGSRAQMEAFYDERDQVRADIVALDAAIGALVAARIEAAKARMPQAARQVEATAAAFEEAVTQLLAARNAFVAAGFAMARIAGEGADGQPDQYRTQKIADDVLGHRVKPSDGGANFKDNGSWYDMPVTELIPFTQLWT